MKQAYSTCYFVILLIKYKHLSVKNLTCDKKSIRARLNPITMVVLCFVKSVLNCSIPSSDWWFFMNSWKFMSIPVQGKNNETCVDLEKRHFIKGGETWKNLFLFDKKNQDHRKINSFIKLWTNLNASLVFFASNWSSCFKLFEKLVWGKVFFRKFSPWWLSHLR